jgi:hypothetical protein
MNALKETTRSRLIAWIVWGLVTIALSSCASTSPNPNRSRPYHSILLNNNSLQDIKDIILTYGDYTFPARSLRASPDGLGQSFHDAGERAIPDQVKVEWRTSHGTIQIANVVLDLSHPGTRGLGAVYFVWTGQEPRLEVFQDWKKSFFRNDGTYVFIPPERVKVYPH